MTTVAKKAFGKGAREKTSTYFVIEGTSDIYNGLVTCALPQSANTSGHVVARHQAHMT